MIKVGPLFEESVRIDETPNSVDLDISIGKTKIKLEFKDKTIECKYPCEYQNQCIAKWGRRTLEGDLRKKSASIFEKWLHANKNHFKLSIIENCRAIQIKLLDDGDYLIADVKNIRDLNAKCQFEVNPFQCLRRELHSTHLNGRFVLTKSIFFNDK